MKDCLKLVLLATILSLPPAAMAELPEPIEPKFDGRQWKVAFTQDRDEDRVTDWVIEGQSLENWRELFSEQFFPTEGMPPQDVLKEAFAEMKTANPTIKIISQTEQEIIFEFQGNDKANLEAGVQRLFSGAKGVHSLKYAVKAATISPTDRDKWIPLLKAAQIKASPENNQAQPANTN